MTMSDEVKKYLDEAAAQQRIQDRAQNELGKQWSDQPAIPFNPRPGFIPSAPDYGPTFAAINEDLKRCVERILKLEQRPVAKPEDINAALEAVIPQFKVAFGEVVCKQLDEFEPRLRKLEDAMELITPSGFAKDREWARKTDQRIQVLENGQLGAKGDVILEFNEQIRELKGRLNKLENPDNRLDNPTVSLRRDVGHLFRAARRAMDYQARLPADVVCDLRNALAIFEGDFE